MSRFDCRKMMPEMVCSTSSGAPECAVEKCPEEEMNESCVEGKLHFCNLGKTDSIDCTDYGYRTCDCEYHNLGWIMCYCI